MMKKKILWASLFCLTLGMFSACSSDDEPVKDVELTGGTTTSQTVFADQTSKDEGIKFTAQAPWTATVKPLARQARASESGAEWLTLSAYRGEAGEHTLKMYIQPNLTGEDRKAEIIITCGDTVIRIQVEQKGVKQDGQKPTQPEHPQTGSMRMVNRIIVKQYDEVVGVPGTDKVLDLQIAEITYNKEGKFVRLEAYQDVNTNYVIDEEERIPANLLQKTEVSYDTHARKAQATQTRYTQGKVEYIHTWDMQLNEAGYVIESASETNHDGFVETYHISYQDGYLVSSKATEPNDPTSFVETPIWEKGNLVKVTSGREGKIFGWSEVTYGQEVNPNISVDINFLVANSEWYGGLAEDQNCLKAFGLYGKRSQNLMLKEKNRSAEDRGEEVHEYTYTKNKEGLIETIDVKSQYRQNDTEEMTWILQYQE